MNVWKPIDQVVLPPKKVYKYILDQNKGYWSHIELIHFWNVFSYVSGCPKFNIILNSVTTCKNCLINAWKPIDLLAILTRSVYNFFLQIKKVFLKPRITNSLLKRFSGFYRLIFSSSQACTIKDLPNFTDFFCFNKKNYEILGKLSWT